MYVFLLNVFYCVLGLVFVVFCFACLFFNVRFYCCKQKMFVTLHFDSCCFFFQQPFPIRHLKYLFLDKREDVRGLLAFGVLLIHHRHSLPSGFKGSMFQRLMILLRSSLIDFWLFETGKSFLTNCLWQVPRSKSNEVILLPGLLSVDAAQQRFFHPI